MGFGNKQVPTNRLSMAAKGSTSDGWGNPGKLSTRMAAEQQDDGGGAMALYATGGLLTAAIVAGIVFFEDLPAHTYGAQEIFVTQMGGSNYKKHTKTFAVVMPTHESVKDDVQFKLSEACWKGPLRSKEELTKIHPMYIHSQVRKARDYLVCTMQTNVERLCEPGERQYLIAQLNGFFQMRANAHGIEKMFKQLKNGSAGGRANMMMFKMMHQKYENDADHYKIGKTRLPKALNSRLAEHITLLSEKGYLTRWDFHWTGMSMPEHVAPYLKAPMSEPACGQKA